MSEFKFFCPQCGQHIQCGTGYSGTQINCPVCQQVIVVPPAPPSAMPVPPQAAPSSAIRRGTPVLAARQQSSSVPVRAKSQTLRKVLVIVAAVLVLAGLVIGGWYGYSKIKMRIARGHLPPGLVALWSGDGNGNDSMGKNNATVPKGIAYAPAEVGQGFDLHGRNLRIIVPDAPELNFDANQDFSTVAWIKARKVNTDLSVMDIFDKRIAAGVAAEPNGYCLCLLNGRVTCQMRGSNFGMVGPDLRDGHFHHVAWTLSRNSTTGGKLYVDGVVVATFDPTLYPGTLVNAEPLRIGNHAAADLNCYFTGIMDELGIYNRALSADEIQTIYKAGGASKQ